MRVLGSGASPVTIHYQINGGPEQTESDVTLPWSRDYTVYEEVPSSVTAIGGDDVLTCSIIFSGDKLVSFASEPNPTCNFAYWD